MDFSTPDHLQDVIRLARKFMRREVYPLESQFLDKGFREMLPVLAQKRETVRGMGLWAPQIPEEYGGQGFSLLEFAHLSEELGRSPLGHFIFNCQAPDAGNMEILIKHGTPEQKERFLLPLVRGDVRSCFAMTEPAYPGSNPTWMGTTALKSNGFYDINGEKWFATAADGAAFAIVMAITNPQEENRYLRASMIIVPTDAPGFVRVRNTSVMGDRGEDYASHSEILFTNCHVPLTNRLGDEGAGFVIAQERLGPGRIHHCMRWIGICERAFDLMCEWAIARETAPGRALGSRQIVQAWIAQSRAEINAARLMVLETAWKIDRYGPYAAREEVSLIKFYVAGVLQRVLDRALQVHGGMGMTDNLPLAYWYRHERAARIYDGPDEVHKLVVARRILDRYKGA
jgi:acyl-CoA dehydrogenase